MLPLPVFLPAGEKATAEQRALRLEREAEERLRAAGEKEAEAARKRTEVSRWQDAMPALAPTQRLSCGEHPRPGLACTAYPLC